MKNKEKVERVYNEIHAPEALVWKVKDMSKEMEVKKFKTRNVVKYAVCALAVMAMTFVASNGICYAATGETLVTKVKWMINGEESELDMNWTKDGDNYKGEVVFPDENGSEKSVMIETENQDGALPNVFINSDDQTDEEGNVVEDIVTVVVDDDAKVGSVTVEEK